MADEFKPINTQEEFDAAIAARLKRERKTITDQYKDYDDLKAKADKYDADIAERDTKIKGYETNSVKMRIAHEEGIPFELVNRLSGETEDEIRADAKSFADMIGRTTYEEPLHTHDPAELEKAAENAGYEALLENLI